MNNYTKVLIALALLVGMAWFFRTPLIAFFGADEPANEPQQAGPVKASRTPVRAVVAQPTKLEDKITITGSVIANEQLELKSEVAGLIMKIHFAEGTQVRKGDLLVSLKDTELQAQLQKLLYNKQLRQTNEYRQKQLLEREAISREEYDIALNELNTVEADISLVKAQIEQTKIYAPFNGTIGLRYISEGSYVSSNDRIAWLFNINPAKIEFSIPGKYSNKVRPDDRIYFTTEASDSTREGVVYAIEPQINATTRTLTMRARANNTDGSLLPGQFTRIELVMQTINNAIMVPSEAVVPELGGHKVFVSRQSKVEALNVEIGIRTDKVLEITEGLLPGDTVITSGILQIRPGLEVDITNLN